MTFNPHGLIDHYQAHGYAVASGLLSEDWCESLIAASQDLSSIADGSYRSVMNVHQMGGMFEKTMAHPDILAVIDALVGAEANGLQSQFFFRNPDSAGFHPHQDNFYVETDTSCFASAWISLVDITEQNGGLYVYPGSHREGRLPVEAVEDEDFDARSGVRETSLVPDIYPRVATNVPRGSVVFMHGHLVHGSHRNQSDSCRYALLNTYLRPGTPFRVGRTGKRHEFPLKRIALAPAE